MPDDKEVVLLMQSLFKVNPTDSAQPTLVRKLSGGYSGAYVAIVAPPGITDVVVMKAGPAEAIEQEVKNRFEFSKSGKAPIFSHRQGSVKVALEWLEKKTPRLDQASDEVLVQDDRGSTAWKAMAYHYFGPHTYEDREKYCDFEQVLKEWNEKPFEDRYIISWFKDLTDQVDQYSDCSLGPAQIGLLEYLPKVKWDAGISAVLETAASLIPEREQLKDLNNKWWVTQAGKMKLCPWPELRVLHGDLRFANILINKLDGQRVVFIDLGNVQTGHLFQDLARFECDLLFRVDPSPINGVGDSAEGLRARTLEAAFGGSFIVNCKIFDDNGHEVPSPHLKLLSLLRTAYDQKWNIGSKEGYHTMYRWFLLREVLTRLLWWEDRFAEPDIRRALVKSVVMLKQAIETDGQAAATPGFTTTMKMAERLGCTEVYIPTPDDHEAVNRTRNEAKRSALEAATNRANRRLDPDNPELVRLIAETGDSFLSSVGGRFYEAVRHFLQVGGRLEAVVVNPCFIEEYGISISHRGFTPPCFPGNTHEVMLEDPQHKWYRALVSGVAALKDEVPNANIEIKIARFGIPATILLTKDVIFYEPYFKNDRRQRNRWLFDTFELKLTGFRDQVFKMFNQNWDFYWEHSDHWIDDTTPATNQAVLGAQLDGLWTKYGPILLQLHNQWQRL